MGAARSGSVVMTVVAPRRTGPAYQTMLVVLLGINMGMVFLDRGAFGLLAPLIQPEFGLNNTQIGMVNGALAVTWALSSFGLCRLADMTGRSKLLLVGGTVIFSVASISSGLAVGFLSLVAARALMGIAEGGLPPVSTHVVSIEIPPERRGLAIGMLSTLGINVIPLLGPLVIVGAGQILGWREAFWIAGIPGLILAALIALLVRNPAHERARGTPRGSVIPLLRIRNIRFTMVLAALNMSCVVILTGFLPLYLVTVLGLSNAAMGAVVTVATAASIPYGFIGPMLSDRFGRKPVLIGCFAISCLGFPLIALSGGSLPLVFAGALFGGGFMGAAILVMNVIPGESAPVHLRATAMGFNAAVGEMIGAGAMPVGIGWVADQIGLSVLPWLFVALALLVCMVTLCLKETAPKLAASGALAPA